MVNRKKSTGGTLACKCQDCGNVQVEDRLNFHLAAPPRCVACGGLVRPDKTAKIKKRPKDRVCKWKIPYPGEPSEFEIQSYLYTKLRAQGVDVRGEVGGTEGDRFDLVLFNGDNVAVRIIEVKKRHVKASKKLSAMQEHEKNGVIRARRQVKKYKRYDVPVDMVAGMTAAIQYIQDIRAEPHAESDWIAAFGCVPKLAQVFA